MKFKLANGGTIEVSGIKKVVENIERDKVRQEPTTVWRRYVTKRKTIRWLRYDAKFINITTGRLKKGGVPTSGCSDKEMKQMILITSKIDAFDVWSHGDTVNVVLRLERVDKQKAAFEKMLDVVAKRMVAYLDKEREGDELHKSG